MSVNEYKSVTEAIEGLTQRGFTSNFMYLDNAIRALESNRHYRAEELTIVEHHRFEGESDPEDMAIVYALQASDGVLGVLVDAFGAYANPALGSFLRGVRRREAVA